MGKGVWNKVWLWFSQQRRHPYFDALYLVKWEKWINSIKNCSFVFIRPGTVSVKKDTIKIHCLSEPLKVATNLEWKSKMGPQPFLKSLIQDTPIGKAIKKGVPKIKMSQILFNSAYYQNKHNHFWLSWFA